MLPLGYLGPTPGWGSARQTRLTHHEQRTLLTLWCMFRSPLMMGGNLTLNDAWTTSLLTNSEVLAVDQHSTGNHPVLSTDTTAVWAARAHPGNSEYLAVFNLGESSATVRYAWKDLGLANASYRVRDLWERNDLGPLDSLSLTLPSHGAALLGLGPAAAGDAVRP